jgi:hypothetical protein
MTIETSGDIVFTYMAITLVEVDVFGTARGGEDLGMD